MAELFDNVASFIGSDRSLGVLCDDFGIGSGAEAERAAGLAASAILANVERHTVTTDGLNWIESLAAAEPITADDFRHLAHHPGFQRLGEATAPLVLGSLHGPVVHLIAEHAEITESSSAAMVATAMWLVATELGGLLRHGWSAEEVGTYVRQGNDELVAEGWGPWLQATGGGHRADLAAVPAPAPTPTPTPTPEPPVADPPARSYPPPVSGRTRPEPGRSRLAPAIETSRSRTVGGPDFDRWPDRVIDDHHDHDHDHDPGPGPDSGPDPDSNGRGPSGPGSRPAGRTRLVTPRDDHTPVPGLPEPSPWPLLVVVSGLVVLCLVGLGAYRQLVSADTPAAPDPAAVGDASDAEPTDTSLLDASEHSDEETPTTPAPQELAIVELELSDPAERTGATATATLRFDQEGGAVCYQFDVEGLQAPYTGWIERGPTGVAGTMIADLGQLSEVPIGCAPVAALDLDQILNDPAAYQVAIGDAAGTVTIRSHIDADIGDRHETFVARPGAQADGERGAYIALEPGAMILRGAVTDQDVVDRWIASFDDIDLGETEIISELTLAPNSPWPSGRIVVGEAIAFELGSSNLLEADAQVVDDLVGILQARPRWSVTIVGHTDSTGDEAVNRNLSLMRAAAVSELLAEQGVDPAVLAVRGAGSSDPIAADDTPEGRAANRRIEFEIVGG